MTISTKRAIEIANIIWSQIPTIYKMRAGACKPKACIEKHGPWEMAGVVFHINPAVNGFISLDVDIERRPRFLMRILLNEGADLYIMQRLRVRSEKDKLLPEPVKDWEIEDVYFDQLGEMLDRMTSYDPPSPRADD